ncbi:MAG: rRNA maturation RNase YbeY [Opitutales bacterium]
MPRAVEVNLQDPRLRLEEASVSRLFHFLDEGLEQFGVGPGALDIAFVDERTCCSLHEAFFHDPSLTDVMTFPGSPEDGHLGDLAICPAYAAEHAADFGHTFADELTLYLVHGWLHLAGLDDRDADHRAQMRSAERAIMAALRAQGLIISARWMP